MGISFLGGSLVSSVTKNINSESQLKQLKTFSRKHSKELGPTKRALKQSMEQADANIKWMKQNYDTLINWFTDAIS